MPPPSFCSWRTLAFACLPVPLPAQTLAEVPPAHYPTVVVQDKAPAYRQFSKVEITGSAILAKETKDALPIQVIDRREIERSGASTLSQLIPKLSVMSNFQESGFTQGTVLGGLDSAAIHGNESGTLILLNGRRLPYYGIQTILGDKALVDLNLIPLVAVEKIEILTSGASSRYGSDAVAGVMNIITKSQETGWSLNVDHAQALGGSANRSASLSWGQGQLERDGYSVRGYLTVGKQDLIAAGEHSVTAQGAKPYTINGQTYWKGVFYSVYSAPALNYSQNGSDRNISVDVTGKCPADWYYIYGRCQRNTQAAMTLYPQVDKAQAYFQADKLLANGWQVFMEGLHTQYGQEFIPDGTYYANEVTINDRKYYWEGAPIGLLRQRYANQASNFATGVKGTFSDWDFQLSTSAGRHSVQRLYIDGIPTRGWRNIPLTESEVLEQAGHYSAQTLAKFAPYKQMSDYLLDRGHTHFSDISMLMSRELADSSHGPVNLGMGVNVRNEALSYGDRQAVNDYSAKRQISAFHAELQIPLGPSLESIASVRNDRYSDFGNVSTGKLALKWRPSAQWMWRGSVGTGFRAPTLGQLTPIEKKVAGGMHQGTEYTVYNSGNPDLKPERSVQTMFGFRFEPNSNWSAGADLWNLTIKDTFGFRDTNLILTMPELFNKYVQGTDIFIPNENLGENRSRGIDYDVQWRRPTEAGRWRLGLRGTHFLKSERSSATGNGFESNLGRYSETQGSAIPRNRFSASAFLEQSQWTTGLTLNFLSGRKEQVYIYNDNDEAFLYSQRVPGFWTLDFATRWQPSKAFALAFSVENLTNNFPPFLLQTTNNLNGVDTRFASYLGRIFKLKVNYKF